MQNANASQLNWDSLKASDGSNIVIDFETKERQIVLIPFDAIPTDYDNPIDWANKNKAIICSAVNQALVKADWIELVSVGDSKKLFQIWVKPAHFSS